MGQYGSLIDCYNNEEKTEWTPSLTMISVRIQPKDESKMFIREWVPGTNIAAYLISATIEAVKPWNAKQ
jgi:hypothetical protein